MTWRTLLAIGGLALLAGCSSNYYSVYDRSTGQTFYTRHITQYPDGSVAFVDSASARDASVHSPEVHRITAKEYDSAWRYQDRTVYRDEGVIARPAGAKITPEDQGGSTPAVTDHDQSYRKSTRSSNPVSSGNNGANAAPPLHNPDLETVEP